MKYRSGWLLVLLIFAGPPLYAQASFIVLARHAEKAAPTGDVGLTAAGEQRARDLARALTNVRLAAVITTQYQRTRLTAAPSTSAAGLTASVVPATGDMAADARAVIRALDSLPPGSAALVVGHSNTLGPIIAALGGPNIPDLCDAEYSTLLVLVRSADGVSLLRGHYGAAEPESASHCEKSL